MKRSLLLLIAALATVVRADVKLPALFTDHLVLQRGKPVPVWGWADAGEEVTVKFATQSKKAAADKDGAWKVTLEALSASSEPADLTVSGKNQLTLHDVLVGEVWICSGQSNMELSVASCLNAKEEMAAAKLPQIRLFTVPRPQLPAEEPQNELHPRDPGHAPSWSLCSPETVGSFSAAAYYFGRELHDKLQVPIGLVNSSWGGTCGETWTSKAALEAVPTCKVIVDAWEARLKTYNPETDKKAFEARAEATKAQIEKIKEENTKLAAGATPQPLPRGPGAWEDQVKSPQRPGALFDSMIHPLVPYAVRGVIWYQGEANRGRADQYRKLLPTLIKDWRKQWHDDISFYIVQLAGYGNGKTGPREPGADDPWAELQWAQLQTALQVQLKPGKCGLAVTNDIGDESNIHPKNKQEVGRRLALQALAKDYKQIDLVSGGPIYAGGTHEGSHFVINFSNSRGLKARDGGALQGFIIAGEDKVWKTAKAVVKNGKQVHVWNDEVKKPVAVRYAWASWCPEANLVNKEGLPTSVFRTDSWDLSTKGMESPFGGRSSASAAKR